MYRRGFTLVELLLVCALIAIFATVIIASTGNARSHGRDSRRYADLAQLTSAIESYYQSNYGANGWGSYPNTKVSGTAQWFSACNGHSDYIPGITPTYIPSLPTDPSGCNGTGTIGGGYVYKSDGINYKLVIDGTIEQGGECMPGKQYYDPQRPTPAGKYCAIFTVGAATW